ncbi:MAG: hypothetical protein JXR19_06205 [Bacteroidia bacterium]
MILSCTSQAQLQGRSHEIGFFGGASNYHGDLADEIVFSETHAAGGIFYRYNINQFWAYRPMISYMRISGSDQNFEENVIRNLSFQSDIIELSNTLELNYQPFSNSPFHQNATFYAFVGFSMYYHNPKALMNDEWFELSSMNNEGQTLGNDYHLFQFSIPFGGGFKYNITPNLITSVELGWRRTFTDYLDDVSTVYPENPASPDFSDRSGEVIDGQDYIAEVGDMRGDPNNKDWYVLTGISLSYRFTPIKCWSR